MDSATIIRIFVNVMKIFVNMVKIFVNVIIIIVNMIKAGGSGGAIATPIFPEIRKKVAFSTFNISHLPPGLMIKIFTNVCKNLCYLNSLN